MAESQTTPAATPATVPMDARFRAGADDYQLGDDDEQNLGDFGNDHTPTPDNPAEEAAQRAAREAATTEKSVADTAAETAEQSKDDDSKADDGAKGESKEPEAAKGESEGEKKPQRSPVIPRERFDDVNSRLQAALARNAELEAAVKAAPKEPEKPAFDFDAAEDRYADALLDGDKALAKQIRQEIRAAEAAQRAPQPEQPAVSIDQVKAALRFDDAVAELNAKYPVFDPKSDTHDAALTSEAVALSRTYQSLGLEPATALHKAVRMIVAANSIQEAGAPAASETKEPAKEEPAKAPEKKEAPKLDPKAVADKIALQNKQPPAPTGAGVKEPSHDLDSMTEEEFAALPKATLARLRGDFV